MTNFEIFRMREKQVPVDVVEMKGNSNYLPHFQSLTILFNIFLVDACMFVKSSHQHVTFVDDN